MEFCRTFSYYYFYLVFHDRSTIFLKFYSLRFISNWSIISELVTNFVHLSIIDRWLFPKKTIYIIFNTYLYRLQVAHPFAGASSSFF